jgi:hypothetical protein
MFLIKSKFTVFKQLFTFLKLAIPFLLQTNLIIEQ